MTQSETLIAHCLWMSQWDENYAHKAAKWYGLLLEDQELLPRFEAELKSRTDAAAKPRLTGSPSSAPDTGKTG